MSSSKKVAVVDADWPKYSVAAAGQNNSIIAIHKQSGDEYKCTTRTEFWGHHSRKAGGILAEINKSRDSPFIPDEFEIQDVYTLEPIQNVLHSAKVMIEGNIKASGASSYVAYLGEGVSFREGLSTIKKYKDRTSVKPHYLDEVTEYIKKKFNPIVVSDLEADDYCVMEAYGRKNYYILGEDKDYYSCPVNFYNVNRPEDGIVDCRCFGHLDRKTKPDGKPGGVIGVGRMHLYYQMAYGDDVDTYHAAAASKIKGGSIAAYNQLVHCKDDREAWGALVQWFKKLYPEPTEWTGWRGDTFEIDWMYVLQEMADMAHMIRFEGDRLNVKEVLDKLGVEY